jgi:hypothetical protein
MKSWTKGCEMAPHYDRHADPSAEQNDFSESPNDELDDEAAEVAAEALRAADIESAQEEFDAASVDVAKLDRMSIDDLRVLARQLDVPNRSTIIDRDELVAAIGRRL